ncbi:MAG TPA: hypothetical protein VNN80_14035 [Polyangiaceae bacterium]|nr:hypothetical protein [Polyangiaceae bacterium]
MKRFLGLGFFVSMGAAAAPVGAQDPAPAPSPPPGMVTPEPPPPGMVAPPSEPPPGMVAPEPPPQAPPPPLVVAPTETSRPTPPRDQRPFLQGSTSLTITVGSAFIGSNDYFILGAGIGQYVLNGLEVGVDGSIWLFDSPTILTLTPQVKYVVYQLPFVKPYFGAFYRHYFVGDDIQDLDSVGARVGVYLVTGGAAYFGFGGLYEHMLDCNENVLECDDWYPEFMIGVSF